MTLHHICSCKSRLDADGHPLARVELPPNSRLAAVRQDRVALVVRASLDVEHVQVFMIEPGG